MPKFSENVYHVPILKDEIINYLVINNNGIYVDGTLGGAGHTTAILEKISINGKLYSIDRDTDAINNAKLLKQKYPNFYTIHGNFQNAKELLANQNINKINGAMLDLGVSSHQLDSEDRGFSYHVDSDLDMRMDTTQGITAKEYLNTVDKSQFISDLYTYSDEKWASRIADKLIEYRNETILNTTFDLVKIVDSAIPLKFRTQIKGHPAKRTFQAVRIAINDEIKPLKKALEDFIDLLVPGARFCVLTFHSIEDRIVKQTFKELENPCICPPKAPICTCGKISKGKVLTRKPILPSEFENNINSRAHSAKLRIFEKK